MKTRKIRGGLFGTETKKQMECLKDIIIVILSAESSYIKEKSQANDSFFKKRIDELNKQSRELKTLIGNSSNKSYFTNKFKGKLTEYEIKRNEIIDILVELIDGIGLNSQEETTDEELNTIFYYFRDLIELLTCIQTHNNKHNCGTGNKNVYEFLKKQYCGSSNLNTISNYVKIFLRSQPLETNISSINSSLSQAMDSPNSASYQSAKSSKSSASYHSAKSSSVASGKRKSRRKSRRR